MARQKRSGQPIRTHPGEVLREEFLRPPGLSANALALAPRAPVTRINDIARERRGVTADTALRLERFFGASAEFWMQLQTSFDLSKTRAEKQDEIQRFIAPRTGGDETKETEGGD